MSHPLVEIMNTAFEDYERIQEARMLYRRGYSWIDAVGNVGLTLDSAPFEVHVTIEDEQLHDRVWA